MCRTSRCAHRTAITERPARADDDWSVPWSGGCGCGLCGTLGEFFADRCERTLEWPLAQARRKHVKLDVCESQFERDAVQRIMARGYRKCPSSTASAATGSTLSWKARMPGSLSSATVTAGTALTSGTRTVPAAGPRTRPLDLRTYPRLRLLP